MRFTIHYIHTFTYWFFTTILLVSLNGCASFNPTSVKLVFLIAPGDALDYLLKNTFTEAAGARKSFPKVLVIITDGKSEDQVESYAKQLRSSGVEIFVLGT